MGQTAPLQETPFYQSTIHDLLAAEVKLVDQMIMQRLRSDIVLVNQLSHYIINSGGKRLRPLLVLLSSKACDYQGDAHIQVAAIVEFIHTATLLHDDVVDASDLRRGKETANAIWGNEASVLVGDFLYSRAFQMMVEIEQIPVLDILAETTNTIAEGEVMQLLNCHEPDTTEAQYIGVIQSKTAKLFEAATRLGAVLAGKDKKTELALAEYGMHLGTAFQLVDDALDYSSTSTDIGKNVGDDLAEGKPTLPLIHAMRNGSNKEKKLIGEAIRSGGLDNIDAITRIIESTHSIEYTYCLAKKAANKAIGNLDCLVETPYKQALIKLAHFAVDRTF